MKPRHLDWLTLTQQVGACGVRDGETSPVVLKREIEATGGLYRGKNGGSSMGQYWMVVNLDKKEYVNAHRLGCGIKLWEQLANHPATGTALLVLLAAMPQRRVVGDLDDADGKADKGYAEVAKRTIGRWAGDRIALVGDYGEAGDIPSMPDLNAGDVYQACHNPREFDGEADVPKEFYTDVSADVRAVIAHELGGQYVEENGFVRYVDVPQDINEALG